MSDLNQFLSTAELFRELSPPEREALVKIARHQTYEKGKMLFWQGDPGSGFFLVKTGKIKVFQVSGTGKEQILEFFQGGQHFAEVAAFDRGSFPASAMAVEDSAVLFFPTEDFIELVRVYPTLAISILAVFARHLRRMVRLIENISLKEVPERVAAYLVTLQDRHSQPETLQLEITKTQLAAVVGTIPETLSRGLTKLTQEGLIKVEGSCINVLDWEGLRRRAGVERESA